MISRGEVGLIVAGYEKFEEVVVGRELKMIALEKELRHRAGSVHRLWDHQGTWRHDFGSEPAGPKAPRSSFTSRLPLRLAMESPILQRR
jgi:hypothetical protein